MKREIKTLQEAVSGLTQISNVLEMIRKKFPKSYMEMIEGQKNLVVSIDLFKSSLKQAVGEEQRLRRDQLQKDDELGDNHVTD